MTRLSESLTPLDAKSEIPVIFCFPAAYRLQDSKSFKRVFKSSDVFFLGKVIFRARKNSLSHPRLGISISKRRVKKATDRNHIKRINRECFRQIQKTLDSIDIVVNLRGDMVSLSRKKRYFYVKKQWEKFIIQYNKLS